MEKRAAVRLQMQSASAVSLTDDLWSSRQMRSYVGITGHILRDWKMTSCKRFSWRHTADNIAVNFPETVAQISITGNVSRVVINNATDTKNAFPWLPGFEHNDTSESDCGEEEEQAGGEDDVDTVLEYLPQHQSCFAHPLQVVIKDALKDADKLKKNLAKVCSIVSYVRKSTVATYLLHDELCLQPANVTRWNSHVKLVRSILACDAEKLSQLQTGNISSLGQDSNIGTSGETVKCGRESVPSWTLQA